MTTVAGHDELRVRAGISYRQLDYWVRCGYVPGVDAVGQGHTREFTACAERRIVLLGRLTRAGFTPLRAVQIAQGLEHSDTYDLGPGLTLRSTA